MRTLAELTVRTPARQVLSRSPLARHGPRKLSPRKGRMTINAPSPNRLYLLQLSASTLQLAGGRTLEMICAAYLIAMSDGQHILIDTGLPAGFQRPVEAPPSRDNKNILEHLEDLRLRPSDIKTVISTHFDVDHAGYHDSLAAAEFIVQREHYNLARAGHKRFAPARDHWDHPSLRYRLVDGDAQLFTGLALLETSGHCPGHQSVLVHLPHTGPVLLVIDAVMLQSQFTMERKPWPNDDNPQMLLASTRKLLDLVEREQVTLVVFGHDGMQWQLLKKAPEFYD